jgi:hypothetical protein
VLDAEPEQKEVERVRVRLIPYHQWAHAYLAPGQPRRRAWLV